MVDINFVWGFVESNWLFLFMLVVAVFVFAYVLYKSAFLKKGDVETFLLFYGFGFVVILLSLYAFVPVVWLLALLVERVVAAFFAFGTAGNANKVWFVFILLIPVVGWLLYSLFGGD